MKNWIGQTIRVGDVVWRGARDGNSSSFKVGKVIVSTDEKITVNWLYEYGWAYLKGPTGNDHIVMPRAINSKGTLKDPNSLVVIHPDLLAYAKLWSDRVSEYNSTGDPFLKDMIVKEFNKDD